MIMEPLVSSNLLNLYPCDIYIFVIFRDQSWSLLVLRLGRRVQAEILTASSVRLKAWVFRGEEIAICTLCPKALVPPKKSMVCTVLHLELELLGGTS